MIIEKKNFRLIMDVWFGGLFDYMHMYRNVMDDAEAAAPIYRSRLILDGFIQWLASSGYDPSSLLKDVMDQYRFVWKGTRGTGLTFLEEDFRYDMANIVYKISRMDDKKAKREAEKISDWA